MWLLDVFMCLFECFWAYKTILGVIVALGFGIWKYMAWKRAQRKKEWDSAEKNVVILHSYGRGYTCPHMSPFGLKLETYLRMAGFIIKLEEDYPMSVKGKTPWITINGVDLSDSQLIIEHLSYTYKDFSSHLTETQKAIARALRVMVDEHLYWGLAKWRYIMDKDIRAFKLSSCYPKFIKMCPFILKYLLNQALHAQGTGRHTDAEFLCLMRKDMESLSYYLGEKPYFMGDEPCEVDCSIFGQLGQFLWNAPDSPFYAMITEDYPNLKQYCLRMKEKFWSDWDQILGLLPPLP